MTSRAVTIRPALDDELDEIAALDRLIFPYDVALTQKQIEAWEWWIAEAETSDVSVAYAAIAPSVQYSDVAYLSRAGVREAFRGLGLQRRFIRVREAWALKNGALWCVTDTSYENTASMTNLIKCGYTPYLPKAPWAGAGSTYWRRKLIQELEAA